METNEKKSLFTVVSEEECATVCGGAFTLSQLLSSLLSPQNQVTVSINDQPSGTTTLSQDGVLRTTLLNGVLSGTFSLLP